MDRLDTQRQADIANLSEKVWLSDGYDLGNVVVELNQRSKDWLSGDGRILAENYVNGQCKIEIGVLWQACADGVGYLYCVAVLQKLRGDCRGQWNRPTPRKIDTIDCSRFARDVDHRATDRCWGDASVFVEDVEMMEGVDKIIPSSIRVETVNKILECDGTFPNLVPLSVGSHFGILGSASSNREIDATTRFPLFAGGGASQMVESGPYIVDGISNAQGSVGGHSLSDAEIDMLQSVLRVEFGRQGVRVCLTPGLQDQLNLLYVEMCST